MKSTRVKRTKGERILRTNIFIAFCLYCLLMIFPFYYLILTSLKTQREYSLNSPFSMPETMQFINYVKAFSELKVNDIGLPAMFINSLWYAFGMTFGNMMVCSMFAYIIARYPFPGSKTIYAAVLIMMSLPISGTGAAAYRLYFDLGLIDNPIFVITNWGGMGYNFIFMERYFRYVAKDYAEAAEIDGAGHSKVFFAIVFPQVISVVSALFVMQFVTYWNDTGNQLLYLKNLPGLATGLYIYESRMIRGLNMPLYFAGLVMSFIPVLILFCVFQNTIMEKISSGGIKG